MGGIKKARVNDGAGTSLFAQENPVTSLPVHPATVYLLKNLAG